jgi:hypothetical protein
MGIYYFPSIGMTSLTIIVQFQDMASVNVKQSLQASMKKWSNNNLNNNSYNGEEVEY